MAREEGNRKRGLPHGGGIAANSVREAAVIAPPHRTNMKS
jgi:hypothetical protein